MSSRPFGAPSDDRDDYSARGGDELNRGEAGAGSLRRAMSHKDVRWPTDTDDTTREAIKNWASGVKEG